MIGTVSNDAEPDMIGAQAIGIGVRHAGSQDWEH
jgi:hypothetical protein